MAESLYLGLSDLQLGGDRHELGYGITVRKTFAHLMAPYIMAFGRAAPGKHHPGPWKPARGGSGFDIAAEMFIPVESELGDDPWKIARTLMFLFRVGVDPAVTASAVSSHSFDELKMLSEEEGRVMPLEVRPRVFQLRAKNAALNAESAGWVAKRVGVAHRLISQSEEFALGVSALESGQFESNRSLTLVSLWSALEALFSRERSELKFRVSSYIAAYLLPYGPDRLKKQKAIAKLYDKRSAAAHGLSGHIDDDLFETFNLTRSVLLKMLDEGAVPTRERLETALFG